MSIICAFVSNPAALTVSRAPIRPRPRPHRSRAASATASTVTIVNSPLASRAPSCSGSHGEASVAVSAPTQWNSGGFSMNGTPPTFTTTQSPDFSKSRMPPKTYASSCFQGSWPVSPAEA